MTKINGSELEKYLGNEIVLTIEHHWDAFHGDDIDHFHKEPYSVRGKLTKIYKDGVVLSGCDYAGYPRQFWKDGMQYYEACESGKSYFPFYSDEKTELSETMTRIVGIKTVE